MTVGSNNNHHRQKKGMSHPVLLFLTTSSCPRPVNSTSDSSTLAVPMTRSKWFYCSSESTYLVDTEWLFYLEL